MIIAIGDSLMAGYGISLKDNWCSLLKSLYGYNIINKGINGDTSVGLLSRLYEDVIVHSPDYAIVLVGTNDIIMNRPIENIADNIIALSDELLKSNIIPILCLAPEIIPIMASKLWCSHIDYDSINNRLNSLRNIIACFSKESSLKVMDFHNLFYALDEHSKVKYYLDGIHLNEKGNRLMAESAHKILKECI